MISKYLLNHCGILPFRVFAKRISRSSHIPFQSPIPVPQGSFPKCHGIISFADPHPLSSVLSYRYKNSEGGGHSQSPIPLSLSPIFRTLFQVPYTASPLFATLMRILHPERFYGTKTAGVWEVFFPFWNSSRFLDIQTFGLSDSSNVVSGYLLNPATSAILEGQK